MRKLKWGVLGCSSFARRRSIPAMLEAPSADLVAVASRTTEKAETFREQFSLARAYGSYEELLQDTDIEAIHITTVNGLHGQWMAKAIAAGKHVLCEKPFTMTLSEAAQIAVQSKGTDLSVMEALVWRFHPQHRQAKLFIDEGRIGDVRLIRAAFTFLLNDPTIRCHPVLGGGSVLDVGGYPLSASRFYFGQEPHTVNTRGTIDQQYQVDINMAGMLEFESGVALIDCGFDSPFRTDLEIVGTKGRLYFPKAWQPPEQATFYLNEEPISSPATNQYVAMIEEISRDLLIGITPKYAIDDALAQAKAVSAVLRSIESGVAMSV